MPKPTLFLIHGLYMHGALMVFLQSHLEKRGYTVCVFSYNSIRAVHENAALLVDFVRQNRQDSEICHFVGHSLGGLLIRLAYEIDPRLFTGRIVTLGTPHKGSLVAKRVAERLHRAILGGSYDDALDGELPEWHGDVELGSLAGTMGLGIGFAHDLPKPNDGTVSVEETMLPYQTDHITLPLSHTALLYSSRVVTQVDHFLQNAIFLHESN